MALRWTRLAWLLRPRFARAVALRFGFGLVREGGELVVVLGPSYPRRQQCRRLVRAGGGAAAGVAAAVAAVLTGAAGAGRVAGLLLVAALGCLVCTRHWARLAARSRVGAHSERDVRRALSSLRGEGWRLRHCVRWEGRGDVDTVALAPSGLGFAIGVKTRTFDHGHLAGVREMAMWLEHHREGGVAGAPFRSCVSCARARSSGSRTGC